ncbi:hypothetical protein EMIHUDRAFT_431697 [Emiliania huxleyi CCMP1516]|uniref:Ribosomal RNA methyltransferase FtsJ domain-containing protein n=2 Tax=Emiliania huxleyi TaxID=2903 RepID=A0A0D3L0L2_EMIH1|nr:hypothetical protein EMIHUDRAFT_431697 [Emiliania huxleyi CCMP1516]EOD41547.1 hypothetical protein EMIHUDRAFT_431697 [Emiliania huxleyi CCMP1516]|eukprot:XP_005793976.1 hypothetical protein EMIHUDRAFT_431697 [Emiliania huxleyi CCMP1516]
MPGDPPQNKSEQDGTAHPRSDPNLLSAEAPPATDALELILGWTSSLMEVDSVWRALQEEKARGWASEAVDRMWKRRDELMSKANRRTEVFTPSTKKYVRFYREWMPALAPVFAGRAGANRSFADIGASPGGMCEYLVGDLGWRGHAFSLSQADGGFGMTFSHVRLGYSDADLSADGSPPLDADHRSTSPYLPTSPRISPLPTSRGLDADHRLRVLRLAEGPFVHSARGVKRRCSLLEACQRCR